MSLLVSHAFPMGTWRDSVAHASTFPGLSSSN